MIVFYSMLFVVFLLMLIYRFQHPDAQVRHSRPIPWGYAIVSMGYIVFWAALRSGFVDTSAYIRQFESLPKGLSSALSIFSENVKDKGFTFLAIIFKTFVSSYYHYWLALIAIATAIPIMVVFRRKSPDFLYSMLLLISSTTVVWMFNGIRQLLAAAIMFGFGYLISEKKFLKFFFILAVCSTIHGTAWLLLPMYFFATDKPFGKRMILFSLAVIACAVTVAPLMSSMETILADTHYSSNLEQFKEDDGVNPLRVLFSSIPVVLAYLRRDKIGALDNKYINLCVNMSTIATGIYFVGIFTSGIMIGRIPIYFVLYSYILLPFLLTTIYKGNRMISIGVTIGYLLFFMVMAQNLYYISDILGNYV